MIVEVEGDILLSSSDAIAHGVAPNDDFNSGLAFSLKERWPALYKDFRKFSHHHHPKEGTVWKWESPEGTSIYNLFTQEHSKDHNSHPGKATTSYVNHSLKELNKQLDKDKPSSLALPRLATGVGGLEWGDVFPLIETHLGKSETKLFLYTKYSKGVKGE